MLIRRAQMDVFRKKFDAGLVDHAIAFLRDELPSEVEGIPDDVLRGRVEWSVERARRLGIVGGMALQIFLVLTFGVGPHFDRHPVVKKIIHDTNRPGKDRMAEVMNGVTDCTWEEMTILAGKSEWIDDVRQGTGAA